MKKIMMLTAALLAIQTLPVFAQDDQPAHEGKKHRGERMFEEQDANKDGAITEDEFVAFMKKKFVETDGNKDGKVTKEEAKAHFEAKRAEWKAKREAMKKEKQAEAPKEAPKAE